MSKSHLVLDKSMNDKWVLLVSRFSSLADHSKRFNATCYVHSNTHTALPYRTVYTVLSSMAGNVGFSVLPNSPNFNMWPREAGSQTMTFRLVKW